MQVKRLAAASVATLIAAAPLAVKAQTNVTVYGVVDAAIESADTGGAVGRHTNVQSGNQSGSRFGFRGSEDLGNGLKAIFNLEAGVAVDTGAQDSSGLFQRRAVVGLEGEFGTLTLGREYSPLAAVAGATDEFGQGFYGNNLSSFGSGRLTRRLANSVNYKSASFNGFDLLATYSAGEKNPGPSGDLKGIGAEFKQGGLYLGAAYHTVKRLSSGDDKEYGAGVAYTFADIGGLEVKANYLSADPEGANNKFKQYNLGAGYPVGASKFYVNLQQSKLENGAKGNAWALAYSYSLSKRTNLYATYASLNNNGLAAFGLNSGSNNVTPAATELGADPSVFTVGIRHAF
ncbi:porin [Massilia pinisoli]|uniref:Porin n=1 Tax=Massilia pinisoli TaxID=1772194 RepID=A0ABT1ZV13_9BURK|nr:porin [Massilia pinisoli]MCS0583724.1 porin [Massilia pinisoli]